MSKLRKRVLEVTAARQSERESVERCVWCEGVGVSELKFIQRLKNIHLKYNFLVVFNINYTNFS